MAVLLVSIGCATVTSGCYDPHLCGADQYPVQSIEGGGGICIRKDEPVPTGYRTFEPGHTPTVH